MTGDKPAPERQREREKNLVGRDKASEETVRFISEQLPNISDPETARAVAMLHEQINNVEPPEQSPFEHWHKELAVSVPTVVSVSATEITVETTIDSLEWYDETADVYIRAEELTDGSESIVIESATKSGSDGDTLSFTVSGLSSNTDYYVSAVATAEGDSHQSPSISVTTD
jgi:hypothetical protein